MCSICGCASARHDNIHDRHAHDHSREPGGDHAHGPDGEHLHHHHLDHDHGAVYGQRGNPHARGPGPRPLPLEPRDKSAETDPDARRISVEIDILADNNRFAARNRAAFAERGITALNLMSGPGSGKTTLLVRTVRDLLGRRPVAVIEGDQETCFDADRIRAAGDLPVVQINTGKGCHLDAAMIARVLPRLAPQPRSLLFIENVGNLVCPAAFDLGEQAKVVLLSVTEGDDKPLKYGGMFATADLLLLTKVDLLPYVPFDLDRCVALARRVNPRIDVLAVSALTGEGFGQWHEWLDHRRKAAPSSSARRRPSALREAVR